MGKRARKTRWRTLTITGENSDSEESNTTLEQARYPRGYNPKHQYFNKYTYSSQSTPTRRYQHDSSKSTRSSSTASDNKITFNEDEYTRITTPRQDVLFKKGYLSKPKTYQTQTSTGTSTYSTGNSTGNGTPDHQSTDLEYESQFVFPNGFVDQNGVYYINGYEPYPLMVYNPPTYYEYSNSKTKRGSTSSPTESGSPHNEETTSQDLSQSNGENVSNVSELNYMYNVVYPGFYGVCPPQTLANGQYQESRRIKKRTRRKLSKTVLSHDDTTPEYTDEEYQSSDEILSDENQQQNITQDHDHQEKSSQNTPTQTTNTNNQTLNDIETKSNAQDLLLKSLIKNDGESKVTDSIEDNNKVIHNTNEIQINSCDSDANSNNPQQLIEVEETENCDTPVNSKIENVHDKESIENEDPRQCEKKEEEVKVSKYDLKPDAEEFVPRNYQPLENASVDPNLHFIKLPHPNFVPIAMVNHMGEFPHGGLNPPPYVPFNFISHDPKLFPNFVNFVPNDLIHRTYEQNHHKENCPAASMNVTPKTENIIDSVAQNNDKQINMTHIVSKLEQISKEQENSKEKLTNTSLEYSTENSQLESKPQLTNFETINELPTNLIVNQDKEKKIQVLTQTPAPSVVVVNSDTSKMPTTIENIPQIKVSNKIESTTLKEESKTMQNNIIPPVNIENSKIMHKETSNTNVSKIRNQRKNFFKQENYQRRKFRNFSKVSDENHTNNTYSRSSPGRSDVDFQPNKRRMNDNDKIYSEKVKTTPVKKYISKNNEQKIIQHSNSTPETSVKISRNNNKEKPSPVTANNQSQWISVGRKKRRNKNMEVDDFNLTEPSGKDGENDLYESYDINLLEDVVVPLTLNGKESNVIEQNSSIKEIENPNLEIQHEENELQNVTSDESKLSDSITTAKECNLDKVIPEVTEIEKQLINDIISNEQEFKDESKLKESAYVKLGNTAKKSKKNITKPVTKRIIITDTYDTVDCELQKCTPIKEVKQTVIMTENKQPKIETESSTLDDASKSITVEEANKSTTVEDATESPAIEEATEKSIGEKLETPSKSSKKKKKKSKQILLSNSVSSSNTTINVIDSYDLLLETSLSNESEDRTNVEISLELDKMIQKGMYNNLEEKIKSLTPIKNDGFFKTIMKNIPFGEPSVKTSNYIKTPDFSKLLRNAALKPSFTMGSDKIIDLNPQTLSLPDLNATSSSDSNIFLENPQVNKILEDVAEATSVIKPNVTPEVSKKCAYVKKEITDAVPKNEVKNSINQQKSKVNNEMKSLGISDNKHPITDAVKTWMIKTRENTPELELLKSPSTIYKEFCDRVSDSEDELDKPTESQINRKTILSKTEINKDNDEEVTVFSMGESFESNGPDLLDCWDNEISVESPEKESNNCDSKILNGANCANGCVKHNKNEKIYDGDDTIDVYESKYGQNEDFLKFKTEVTERHQQRNFPKHGDLPYRAICCNIM